MTAIWLVRADVERCASIELSRSDYDRLPVFDGRLLNSEWPSFDAKLTDRMLIGDFAYLTAGTFACRRTAWDQIKAVIGSEVEALPINVEAVPFVVLNVTNIVACLDRDRSNIRYFPGSDRVYRVMQHVFHRENLVSSHLFKVPELRTDVFSSDWFRSLIEMRQLRGLLFNPVMEEEHVDA
jgi:hypothetical protein